MWMQLQVYCHVFVCLFIVFGNKVFIGNEEYYDFCYNTCSDNYNFYGFT